MMAVGSRQPAIMESFPEWPEPEIEFLKFAAAKVLLKFRCQEAAGGHRGYPAISRHSGIGRSRNANVR